MDNVKNCDSYVYIYIPSSQRYNLILTENSLVKYVVYFE
jgi:hypothetical protein